MPKLKDKAFSFTDSSALPSKATSLPEIAIDTINYPEVEVNETQVINSINSIFAEIPYLKNKLIPLLEKVGLRIEDDLIDGMVNGLNIYYKNHLIQNVSQDNLDISSTIRNNALSSLSSPSDLDAALLDILDKLTADLDMLSFERNRYKKLEPALTSLVDIYTEDLTDNEITIINGIIKDKSPRLELFYDGVHSDIANLTSETTTEALNYLYSHSEKFKADLIKDLELLGDPETIDILLKAIFEDRIPIEQNTKLVFDYERFIDAIGTTGSLPPEVLPETEITLSSKIISNFISQQLL